MELNNIPADYRICSKRLHADCVKVGPASSFRTNSKTCNLCFQQYLRLYYQEHKENLLERAKVRAKAHYIPRVKAVV